MQLRSPAEFFYKYLVIHPETYTNATIQNRVEARGIDWISNEYVDRLRASLNPPSPFRPRDETHQASFQFLCEEQLMQLFFPDRDTQLAIRLIDNPRTREFVETMLLSHAPKEAISKAVTRNGTVCTSRAIARYGHYFWNVDLLDSTQMKILLQWRFERVNQVDENGVAKNATMATATKKASYQDPRRLAADLPFSPFAAMLVQMRMGMMPSQSDIAQRMLMTRDMATMRALEVLHYATPGDAGRAFNYAMTAKIMNEMLETMQKPDETLRKELSAIALRTSEQPVPSIHALSGGRHTVDLLPTTEGTYEPRPLDDPGERK